MRAPRFFAFVHSFSRKGVGRRFAIPCVEVNQSRFRSGGKEALPVAVACRVHLFFFNGGIVLMTVVAFFFVRFCCRFAGLFGRQAFAYRGFSFLKCRLCGFSCALRCVIFLASVGFVILPYAPVGIVTAACFCDGLLRYVCRRLFNFLSKSVVACRGPGCVADCR
jgi:hypothetical protein